MAGKAWKEHHLKMLEELWNGDKHSGKQIAEILGPEFNRNMVIGQARRSKLKEKGRRHPVHYGNTVTRRPPQHAPRRKRAGDGRWGPVLTGALNRPAIQRVTLPAAVDRPVIFFIDSDMVFSPDTILDGVSFEGIGFYESGPDHCRYPLKCLDDGTIFDYRSCGKKITSGSYCRAHAKLCYRPANWR